MYQEIIFECPTNKFRAYLVHKLLNALFKEHVGPYDTTEEPYIINVYAQQIKAEVVEMLCVAAIEQVLEIEVTKISDHWYQISENEETNS